MHQAATQKLSIVESWSCNVLAIISIAVIGAGIKAKGYGPLELLPNSRTYVPG